MKSILITVQIDVKISIDIAIITAADLLEAYVMEPMEEMKNSENSGRGSTGLVRVILVVNESKNDTLRYMSSLVIITYEGVLLRSASSDVMVVGFK